MNSAAAGWVEFSALLFYGFVLRANGFCDRGAGGRIGGEGECPGVVALCILAGVLAGGVPGGEQGGVS